MNTSNINNFINVKNDILSNGCDKNVSPTRRLSIANFLCK